MQASRRRETNQQSVVAFWHEPDLPRCPQFGINCQMPNESADRRQQALPVRDECRQAWHHLLSNQVALVAMRRFHTITTNVARAGHYAKAVNRSLLERHR